MSSNIDEVLMINPSANVLGDFGDLMSLDTLVYLETLVSIIRTDLFILVELINLVSSVIIFNF